MLSDWDECELPDGKTKIFSVVFVKANGECVFVPFAKKAGLRANMKKTDYKAIQPTDREGNPVGHITPVYIHAIIEYSGNIKYRI